MYIITKLEINRPIPQHVIFSHEQLGDVLISSNNMGNIEILHEWEQYRNQKCNLDDIHSVLSKHSLSLCNPDIHFMIMHGGVYLSKCIHGGKTSTLFLIVNCNLPKFKSILRTINIKRILHE